VKVVFTADARRAADALDAWWREHRDHKDVFEEELEAAVARIGSIPEGFAVYAATRRGLVRRLQLPKTKHHVYFLIDSAAGVARIVAVWGAQRRRGPPLR
jgi:hypothetical protein